MTGGPVAPSPSLLRKAGALPRIEQIQLVEHLDDAGLEAIFDAELGQHPQHVGALLGAVRMGAVTDMHDEVGGDHFLQGRAERCHEVVRQVGNEAHGVGQDDTLADGRTTPRMVGSRVAKSWSRASAEAPVSRLKSVVFPAFVYPTRAITG